MPTIINLDSNFLPFDEGAGNRYVEVKKINFPSGCEPHIKIDENEFLDAEVTITCRINTSEDFIRLLLTIDAVKRKKCTEKITLIIPYLPFARQDRVMVEGEPLSIKVIADILNLQNLSKVWVYDAHSEVALALINNCENAQNHSFVNKCLSDKKDLLIVSPDAGAYKKIFKLCQSINYQDEIILCNKTRNVATGEITSIICPTQEFFGKDLYIVDDICDGGGTFILLAEELRKRNCGTINLIVSHGIFSKGIDALHNIDHIYTTNSFKDFEPCKKLTQHKLKA